MSSPASAGARFRAALAAEKPLQVIGAINANHALLAQRAGYKAIYLSGGGVAAGSLGLPDLGINTLDDVLVDTRRITDVCDLPLLVDIDTGFGPSAFNIERTIKSLIKAGAAACHIEDQVGAKRCGHRPGKEIVTQGEMVDRVKAAADARTDSNFFLIARTDEDPDNPRAGNSAFIVDLPSEGWNNVRDIETLSGSHNHCEIVIEDLRVHKDPMLGGRGQGHLLGQYRLGPARLAHCMRWIAQAETALELMVDRSLSRYAHGSLLADKQGIQWMIADSAMELYQSKLMVLHAASLIDKSGNDPSVVDFRPEVSMAKHFVANSLWRIIDRAVQVHGALGYSSDSPLGEMLKQARWAGFTDGADEVHQWLIAERTISDWKDNGTVNGATGKLPL